MGPIREAAVKYFVWLTMLIKSQCVQHHIRETVNNTASLVVSNLLFLSQTSGLCVPLTYSLSELRIGWRCTFILGVGVPVVQYAFVWSRKTSFMLVCLSCHITSVRELRSENKQVITKAILTFSMLL